MSVLSLLILAAAARPAHAEWVNRIADGIMGTRITVEQVLETLSERTSIDNVLKAHPHLTADQIHAALAFKK